MQKIKKGKYEVICFEQWDGYANNLDVIIEMEKKGYSLIDTIIIYSETLRGNNIAENTIAEMLFKRELR